LDRSRSAAAGVSRENLGESQVFGIGGPLVKQLQRRKDVASDRSGGPAFRAAGLFALGDLGVAAVRILPPFWRGGI
jgi:hypothetical protein